MLTKQEKTDLVSAGIAIGGIVVATAAAMTTSPFLMGGAAVLAATSAAVKILGPSENDKDKPHDSKTTPQEKITH